MVRERLGKTKEACQHIFENLALMMSQSRGPSRLAVDGLWECVRVRAWLLAATQ
jgi:hypothetical protein